MLRSVHTTTKMPWTKVKLNTGAEITGIGFGTWTMGNGGQATDQVEQAIDVGFDHIDTAQSYRNEDETGQALRESGVPRTQLFITTKYSGRKASVEESINDSIEFLGTSYVDLYLVHHPQLANGNIPALWREMERLHAAGKAKAVGVSNFSVDDLKTLLKEAKVVPAVNQILLHPYVYEQQRPIIEFCHEKGIVIEAYSPLVPITRQPGGPVDDVLNAISKRTGATTDQILLAWNKSKGSVVLTTSSKRSRLEGYIRAGDLALTQEDIDAIDAAGAKGPRPGGSFRLASDDFTRRLLIVLCGLAVLARIQYGGGLGNNARDWAVIVLGCIGLSLLVQDIWKQAAGNE